MLKIHFHKQLAPGTSRQQQAVAARPAPGMLDEAGATRSGCFFIFCYLTQSDLRIGELRLPPIKWNFLLVLALLGTRRGITRPQFPVPSRVRKQRRYEDRSRPSSRVLCISYRHALNAMNSAMAAIVRIIRSRSLSGLARVAKRAPMSVPIHRPTINAAIVNQGRGVPCCT